MNYKRFVLVALAAALFVMAAWMAFAASIDLGYSHPLDGQVIEFDPPIGGDDLPAPWLTLWQEPPQEGAIPERSVTA